MSSVPPPGLPPSPLADPGAALQPLPWDDRARLGVGTAIVQSAELLVLRPREAFLRARRRGDVLSPTLWVLLVSLVGELLQLAWTTAIDLPLRALVDGGSGFATLFLAWGGGAFAVLFGPVAAAATAFVVAGILHGCLALLGGLDRSLLGYDGSLRAVAYAHTAQLALVLPVVGRPIAFVWMLPLVALGLATLHDTTFGRALAAVLIPLLACCLCGALFGALFGAALAGLVGGGLSG